MNRVGPSSHVIAVIFWAFSRSALAYLLWAKALSFAATTSDVTKFMFDAAAFVLCSVCRDRVARRGNMDRRGVILSGLALFHLRPAGEEARRAAMRHDGLALAWFPICGE